MEFGVALEFAQLPEGRHSAAFVDGASNLCIRWRRRKHRPGGSLLRRPCTCGKMGVGLRGPEFCVVHTFLEFHGNKNWLVGDKIFELTPNQALHQIKRVLLLLGVPDGNFMAWKAVRAGRATSMAAEGLTLGEILEGGEWRSAAYLKYVNEEVADAGQLLRTVVQKELDEDED